MAWVSLLDRIETLDPLARGAGGVGVLSVGLAPGLTNVLAASLLRRARHDAPRPPRRARHR